jgi:glycine cleavage system H lipoate-binding protein
MDTRVKYCQASIYRKMIVQRGSDVLHERCSSPTHVDCPAAPPMLREQEPVRAHCPFLREAHAEYCGAASLTRYIPASDALLSRCKSDGHLYCELYMTCADPSGERLLSQTSSATQSARMPVVDDVPVPANLYYAPNHMWLDVAEDGNCHVGIDAFLARVLGTVEAVSFVKPRSVDRPVAVLTVEGVDMQMAFPNAMQSLVSNVYLRTAPAKLTADPYGAGWLFEGTDPDARDGRGGTAVRAGLLHGEAAARWIADESERLSAFVHERVAHPAAGGEVCMADGGGFAFGVVQHLERDDRISLFNEFFAPQTGWRRSW